MSVWRPWVDFFKVGRIEKGRLMWKWMSKFNDLTCNLLPLMLRVYDFLMKTVPCPKGSSSEHCMPNGNSCLGRFQVITGGQEESQCSPCGCHFTVLFLAVWPEVVTGVQMLRLVCLWRVSSWLSLVAVSSTERLRHFCLCDVLRHLTAHWRQQN